MLPTLRADLHPPCDIRYAVFDTSAAPPIYVGGSPTYLGAGHIAGQRPPGTCVVAEYIGTGDDGYGLDLYQDRAGKVYGIALF